MLVFACVATRGRDMKTIDYRMLLGFSSVSEAVGKGVDFRDETLGSKLGAKIGQVEPVAPGSSNQDPATLDYRRLFGFSAMAESRTGGIDFRHEEIAAKVGAKVGDPEA